MERLHAADGAASSPVAPASDAPQSSAASSTVEAVASRVWEGCVPVVFTMDPTEVTALHAPRPFYVRLPCFKSGFCCSFPTHRSTECRCQCVSV